MNKVIRTIAILIVSTFALSCFGYLVYLASRNSQLLGSAKRPILTFAKFPGTLASVLQSEEIQGIPPAYIPRNDGTAHQDEAINQLKYDLYGLNTFYEVDDGEWLARLVNFRTDDLIHEWTLPKEGFLPDEVFDYKSSQPKNPLLFKDKSLVIAFRETKNLLKLDAQSNILWRNSDFLYHHGMNFDADSSIWSCATQHMAERTRRKPLSFTIRDVDGKQFKFRDDLIVQIDSRTGETTYVKSISEMLLENDLAGLLSAAHANIDPIHVNDIQPVLSSTAHWQTNDLFISLRTPSAVLHFRPSTGKVLKVLQGPFIHQHDVDIISDHELSIFNNNWYDIGEPNQYTEAESDLTAISSEITVYDYETDTYRSYLEEVMKENRYYTPTGGIHHILSNGDVFLDMEDVGRIAVIDSNGVNYQRIYPSSIEGYKHLTNWTRTFETLNFD